MIEILDGVSPWLFVVAPLVIVVGVHGVRPVGVRLDGDLGADPRAFLPVSFLVPLMVLLDMTSATIMGTAGRKQVAVRGAEAHHPIHVRGFRGGRVRCS